MANGIIIIDATGSDEKSVLFRVLPGKKVFINTNTFNEMKQVDLPNIFPDFSLYQNNLKGNWSKWQG